MPDDAFEAEEDFMANLGDDQREIERLRAEVEKLRGLVVSRFDHDHPPTFRQGYPAHELEEVTSAEQCTWMVGEIERLRAEHKEWLAANAPGGWIDELRQHAKMAVAYKQESEELRAELEGFRKGSEEMALKGIEMRREIDELRAEIAALREQEPVGVVQWMQGWPVVRVIGDAVLPPETPLYTAPVAQPAVSVPDGWKLVPLEPTNEMMRAGFDVCGLDQVGWLELKYKAMLAAAPEAKP